MQKLLIEFFLLFFRECRNIKTKYISKSVFRDVLRLIYFFLSCLGRQLFVLKVQAIKSALFVNKVEVIIYRYFNTEGQFLLCA